MAEFKLGRIRFVWKGEWAASTTYVKDDVVKYGGRTYICQIGHTSAADFYTDLDFVPTYWNQMTDGTEWRGDWSTTTFYSENDVVKYGGLLYICVVSHTSAATETLGLEADQAKWELYAEGFEWKGNWSTDIRYKRNDLVKYGGYTYLCNTAHTSASTDTSGLEADQAKWDIFSPGVEFKGDWSASSVRYKLNDVVKYGAGLYICTNDHTSAGTFASEESNWSQYVKGFEFESDWVALTTYQPGDIVRYGGNQYIAKTNHSASTVPPSDSTNWYLFSEGFNWANAWDFDTDYKVGDVVSVNGLSFVASQDVNQISLSVTATNTLTNGFTVSSTATIAVGMMVRFSGTTFGDVGVGDNYYVKRITSGTTFTVAITPGGAEMQPTTATGTMTAKFVAHPNNANYWAVLNKGIQWRGTWAEGTEYEVGDTILYGANSYICVLKHKAEQDDGSTIRAQGGGAPSSRPDQDTTGTYWNVLAVGSESSVLTADGDLVYYSESGPTRLPVGKEGQVLRVSTDLLPEWVTLSYQDHTYYVATDGIDQPAPVSGLSSDKPWKTIRYACEQVEKGPRNPDAQKLLELNRAFIQREVTEWIQWQIANAGVGSIWENFVYEDYKCERDTGLVVDAVIHDIGHGGNVKSRGAALAYVNALLDSPGTYTRLSEEADNDVAAFTYMLTVVEDVLNQEAPAVNYQVLNGDNSTAVVEQYFNDTLQAETGVMTTIESLVEIITDAIAAGDADNIPARYAPNNLVKVAAGRYRETLPIIVPEQTCVLGAELRTTNAGPSTGTIPRSDVFYSVKSLGRLSEVVVDIVQGVEVSESTGNTQIQEIEFPYGGTAQGTDAARLARMMQYNIDFRIGTTNMVDMGEPTDYNFAYLQGYGYARSLLEANKRFLQEEVRAWLTSNYPNLKYSKTTCIRDVGYIIDALTYDLTYGGNAQSVVAGLAYYEGVGSNLYIDSTEKTATLAAYEFLKSRMETVAASTGFTALNDVVTQTLGTAGSAASITFIGDRMDDIIDIITNGTEAVGDTTTLTDPSTSWVPAALTSAYSTLTAAVPTIQTNTIDYINSTYGSFVYNSAKCRRDLGIILDGVYYDVALGTNYNAVINGRSYRRSMAAEVIAAQLAETSGAISYAGTLAAASLVGNATAVSRNNAAFNEIIDILENGVASADALTWSDPGVDSNRLYARQQLQTNRTFIVDELSNWISTNYSALWTSLGASGQATCQRDVGYIIDAFSYDIQYGGNTATRVAAQAYFEGAVSVLPSGQKAATSAAFTELGSICSDVVQELYAGQDTSGTAASATEGARMVALAAIITEVIDDDDLDGLDAIELPSITWAAAGIQSAVAQLASDETDIIAETLQFITDNYSSLVYDHAKCSRDVATILKSVGYDFMFDSNFQTIKAAYAYLRATASEVFSLGQKTATRGALEYVRTQAITYVNSNTTAIARINSLMQALDDIIFSGSNEGSPCATEVRNTDYAVLQLERNRDFIVAEISAWMNYNYVNFDNYYDSDVCERDIGYIIDAVCYDLVTKSNFASSIAGRAYYRVQSATVTGSQLVQTIAAVKKAKELSYAYVDSSEWTDIGVAFDNVLNILENGTGVVPTFIFPANGTAAANDITSAATFQANRSTYISSVSSYLNTNYNAQWTALGAEGQATCQRDIGYIVDAVTFDVQYGGNYQSVIAGDSYYSFGTLQIGAGAEKTATLAALGQLQTLMVADAETSSQTATGNNLDDIIDIVTNGAGTVATTYPLATGEDSSVPTSFTTLQAARATIKTAVTTYITDTFSSYTYNTTLCERDVNTFIDAIKYDLKYPGNYKSRLAARYYANAVIGSLEEDMYYLRDGTGIRDQTLEGLNGDLGPANAYGTSRPTAGAYASLDPGWGPDDFRTWIINRSPYVQGVTTFGNGCIGQKIDGALHAGGNDSIVSNDFTQVLSDGIGAWVANNGRAELVSVFTYYNHIGYLCTEGGRIRGTNGNNSYGDFGSVAEGFDATETPNTAVVDNRFQFVSVIRSVNTDGDEMLNFEFDNAGIDYQEATWTLTGGGLGAAAVQDEFRDGGVYQVRLLDFGNDSSGQFGGEGYKTNSNTAQGGGADYIQLAATDPELSTAYIGMKVVITGGAGAGQYGIITTYNSGTKRADVIKESDGTSGWDHFVPGTTIANPDASTTYTVEPRITFSAPAFASSAGSGLTSGTWNSVTYGEISEVYTGVSGNYSGSGATGATFDVIRNGWKYTASVNTAGTGYTRLETITISGDDLGGTTPENDLVLTITSVNSTTGAIIEVDQDGYGAGGRFVAVKGTSTNAGVYSDDGETWTAMTLPSSQTWTGIAAGVFDDGSTVTRISRFVAIASGTTAAAYSEDGIDWTATTMPASVTWNSIAYGNGRFVAIASNSTTVAVSLDGEVFDVTGTLTATGFTDITYGQGKFVAVKSGSNVVARSSDGVTWEDETLPATTTWNSVTYGNGRFVAVSTTSNSGAYSLDGETWTAMTMGSVDESSVAGYQQVSYGQGLFIATAYQAGVDDYSFVATSEDGIVWTARGVYASTPSNGGSAFTGWNAVAFGSPQRSGIWVALPKDAGTQSVAITAGARAKARAYVAEEKIFAITILEPGSGYTTAPTMTVTDPNNLYEAPHTVRIGNGVLANPSFTNRGSQYATGSAEINTGDGYADNYQTGGFVAVRRLSARPVPGSNIVLGNLPDRTFKLVNVITFLGTNDGSYTAFFQVSPVLEVADAPEHLDSVTSRIRYSQVRLTGHDFLDIGTGGFADTNYPGTPINDPVPANETVGSNGGRVFFTSTDQDGNFRVGDLFAIEQSTGIATLNADAFNISGLQELNLGNVTLGGGSATITEFSTDPFFTADSDNVVPTQRAIKAYISAQIGGGGASLNVNSVTAGSIVISSNVITTTSAVAIKMNTTFEFRGGVTGAPLAFNYYFK